MKGSGTRPSWSGLMRFLQLGETSYVKIPWWNSRCRASILLLLWGKGVIMIIMVKLFTYSFICKLHGSLMNHCMYSLRRDFKRYENVYWTPTMWSYFVGPSFVTSEHITFYSMFSSLCNTYKKKSKTVKCYSPSDFMNLHPSVIFEYILNILPYEKYDKRWCVKIKANFIHSYHSY